MKLYKPLLKAYYGEYLIVWLNEKSKELVWVF